MPPTTTPKHILATADTWGNRVVMSAKTWNHIVQRHPEMSTEQAAIKDTIEDPDGYRDPARALRGCPRDSSRRRLRGGLR